MSMLLNLPAEIRHQIYQYHFSNTRVIYHHRYSASQTHWSNDSCVRLLIVCRQMLMESRPVFFDLAQINLLTLINQSYCTFCCPVNDPKLIKHAYINVDAQDCSNLSRVITALPNLKSLAFYTCEASFYLEHTDLKGGLLSESGEKSISEFSGRILARQDDGTGSQDGSYAQAVSSLIAAWKDRQRDFVLSAEVMVFVWVVTETPTYTERHLAYMKGLLNLDTKVLSLIKIDAPTERQKFKITTLEV